MQVPRLITDVLRREEEFDALAHGLAKAPLVLYLGRGSTFPIALEGALKLKEISYLHAEGFAAGELKHGPIALIDETVPVIAMAPKDGLYEKMISNMQEVAARGGQLIVFSDARRCRRGCEGAFEFPPSRRSSADHADPLCGSHSAHRLSYGSRNGHGCGSTAQSRQVGDGGVDLPTASTHWRQRLLPINYLRMF